MLILKVLTWIDMLYNLHSLIFTKLDEVSQIPVIISMCLRVTRLLNHFPT